MLKSLNQIIINSSNLQLICDYETRYSRIAGKERSRITSYIVVNNKGKIIKSNYSNNISLLATQEKELYNIIDEEQNIIDALELEALELLENILCCFETQTTRIRLRNLKRQVEKEQEKQKVNTINKENQIFTSELQLLAQNKNVRVNIKYDKIEIYTILDNSINHMPIEAITAHKDGHKYLKHLVTLQGKGKYIHECKNDSLKQAIEFIKNLK